MVFLLCPEFAFCAFCRLGVSPSLIEGAFFRLISRRSNVFFLDRLVQIKQFAFFRSALEMIALVRLMDWSFEFLLSSPEPRFTLAFTRFSPGKVALSAVRVCNPPRRDRIGKVSLDVFVVVVAFRFRIARSMIGSFVVLLRYIAA